MQETSERERRFRNRMLTFLVVLLFAYLSFKAWHISLALEVWPAQHLDGDTTGAAK